MDERIGRAVRIGILARNEFAQTVKLGNDEITQFAHVHPERGRDCIRARLGCKVDEAALKSTAAKFHAALSEAIPDGWPDGVAIPNTTADVVEVIDDTPTSLHALL